MSRSVATTRSTAPRWFTAAAICVAAVVVDAGPIDGGRTASADPPAFQMFDNGRMRFGGNPTDDCYSGCVSPTTPEASLSALGLLKQPFYYSTTANQWFKLTFDVYPLNLAIGTGTGGPNWSGATVSNVTSLAGMTIDTSGFVSTGAAGLGEKGHGVLQATGTTTVNGTQFEITNRSELGATASFVKITTTIRNISGSPSSNTTMWVGTQDDYVGSSDQPTKTKGNIVNGAFVPTANNADVAGALLIESGPEGVLFYSTTPGANASIASCCSFANAFNTSPTASLRVRTNDGAYAMNLPVADLAAGASTTITWFYAAGATADLPTVISQVAAAARPDPPMVSPGNQGATVSWTAPASTDPITDYIVRYRTNGSVGAWTEVRSGNTSAPLTLGLTGLTNGTEYEIQLAAVTGTSPSEVVGTYSSSATVTPGIPVNTALPTVSGTARVGNTLTAIDPDTNWNNLDGTPMTASYQWQADGVDIPGATSSTFRVTPAQVGAHIRVIATRTNTSGAAHATSAATAIVPDLYLSALSVTGATLSPAFSPVQTSYTSSVDTTVSALTVTPSAPTGAAVTVTVNGVAVTAAPTADVTLAYGDNTIVVTVTRDGVSIPYTVVVNRPSPLPAFNTMTPTRLTDTRTIAGPLGTGTVMEVTVAGAGGVPSDATSAVLNVTVTGTQGSGFVTVYPCGEQRPWASNLNFAAGQTIANAVVSKIGLDGKVCIYSTAGAEVVVDVSGFFRVGAGDKYLPVTPARLVDTREAGVPVADGQVLEVVVAGRGGLPSDSTAAALNVTVAETTGPGFVTVFPCGGDRPLASNLNYVAGQTVSNAAVAKIGVDGKVCIYVKTAAHVVVDVNGAYTPTGPALQQSFSPARLIDTRETEAPVAGGQVLELVVAGRSGVPSNAIAAVLNVTIVGPSGAGFATVFPCGVDRPWASNLNYVAGVTVPNAVIAKIGDGGKVCVFLQTRAHLVVDVSGAMTPL
ncbi:MAG: cadherin-like beta sandwich domain-containing protein [Actinobacteria bacterium]|nr:cadherin-like beta sandwich domain-containing protein [Actinomycetota bacterium]